MANQTIIETRRHQMFPVLAPEEIERVRRFGELRKFAAGEALALTGTMHDRQITRAVELARMVMRESAVKLYGLTTK